MKNLETEIVGLQELTASIGNEDNGKALQLKKATLTDLLDVKV